MLFSVQQPRIRQLIQVFCLLLVVVTLAAALHTHFDSGIKAERHCSVCVAMHSAMPKLAQVTVYIHPAASEYLGSHQQARASRMLVCGLYVRPPPVSSI